MSRSASSAEVREAWKSLMRANHPDALPPEQREGAHARAAAINEAYETLADEKRRRRYDAKNYASLQTATTFKSTDAAELLNQLHRQRRRDRLRVAGAVAAGLGAVAYTLRAAKLL